MSRLYTVATMIEEVRSMLDESSTDNIDDNDIILSINRANSQGIMTLADYYPDPLLDYVEQTVSTKEFTIPENILEDKLVYLDFVNNNRSFRCDQVSIKNLHKYERSGAVDIPRVYTRYGRTIRFPVTPNGHYDVRMWYMNDVDKLVAPAGRITRVESTFLTLTDVDVTFSPTANGLSSYHNIIDGQTGLIKASFQSKLWDGVRLNVRSTPAASSRINRTIGASTSTANVDDYICELVGSCVPVLFNPLHVFIIQYALAELKRNKLGAPYDVDAKLVKDFEIHIKNTYLNTPQKNRISKDSASWGRSSNRRGVTRGYYY